MPFVGLMFVAVILLCFFPVIATGFPDLMMGASDEPCLEHAATEPRCAPRTRARRARRRDDRQGAAARARGRLAARGARMRRPRLPRREQPKAGRLPRANAGRARPGARQRLAHAAIGAGAARAPRRVRARRRRQTRLLVFRPAGRARGAPGRRRQAQYRRDPPTSNCSAATSSICRRAWR